MYTLKDFERDCMNLCPDEVVSCAVDDTHILVGIGYEDCINIELNSGYTTEEANVCEDLLENCCVDRCDIAEIPYAIDYLKNCI